MTTNWERLHHKLVELPEQVGKLDGMTTFDVHEAMIAGMGEEYRVGFDDHWMRGIMIPLGRSDIDAFKRLWQDYHLALNETIQFRIGRGHPPGTVGETLPKRVYRDLYPFIADTFPDLHSLLRVQIMQAAWHREQEVETLEYVPLSAKAYTLLVPQEEVRGTLEPASAVFRHQKAHGLLLSRAKRVPFGAQYGRAKLYPPTERDGLTMMGLDIRCRWQYLKSGTEHWRRAKKLAQELRGTDAPH